MFKEVLDIEFQVNEISKISDQTCNQKIINDKTCYEYLMKGCISLTASTRIFPKSK